VSWLPIDWNYATGRDREPGAIDFTRVKLLEISGVPLPADAAALAAARAIDLGTGTIVMPRLTRAKDSEWKCGASRNLPLDEKSEWDGDAAAESVFEAYGFNGDNPDPDSSKARKAFLAWDSSNPGKKGSYKLPIAKVVDGRLTAVAAGIRNAASRLPQTDIPEGVKDTAREILDHYEDQLSDSGGDKSRSAKGQIGKRDLFTVSDIAYLLWNAVWLKQSVDAEEAYEGDTDSVNPANMAAVVEALAKTLLAMTPEEVSEAVSQINGLEDVVIVDDMRALAKRFQTRGAGEHKRSGRRLSRSDAEALEDIHEHARRTRGLVRAAADACAGADNADDRSAAQDLVETAHDHAEQTRCMVRSYIDERKAKTPAKDDGPDDDSPDASGDDAADERAARQAKARGRLREIILTAPAAE
jgi:hypothetical protein